MTELWRPSEARIARSNLARFARAVGHETGSGLMARLHAWSVEDPAAFWREMWAFARPVVSVTPTLVVDDHRRMPGARWFPGARLNFAENLLRADVQALGAGSDDTDSDDADPDDADSEAATDALVSWNEHGHVRTLSRGELRAEVARFAAGLRRLGVGVGDRVAGFMPNVAETVIAMLGASSLGAVWTACSSDFGSDGALDRLRQVEPRVLVAGPRAMWKGEWQDTTDRIAEIAEELAGRGLEHVVVAGYGLDDAALDAVVAKLSGRLGTGAADRTSSRAPDRTADRVTGPVRVLSWNDLTAGSATARTPAPPPDFRQLPFDHPLYILYSSGTTGPPKCIVHGQGGTLLQHTKELLLHTDLHPGDRIFYYSTCGWMMWNWLVSSLAVGATVVLWDGSPLAPSATAMWDLIDAERITHFGTSAKYLAVAEKRELRPADTHDLSSLRSILSTGSPLLPPSFDWVYDAVKSDVHLASISGGTDIVSCFLLGDPTGPVYRGELQTAGLGMRVEVWDEDGRPCRTGEPGELVCTRAFPSMPVRFLDDPDDARYRATYFEYFDAAGDRAAGNAATGKSAAGAAVWRHGDWIERTSSGGWVVHGRSDTTLNPGGVRIGTAEIYRQVETLDEVLDAVAIGQRRDGDVRVVLFVVLREGLELDDALRERIRRRIREGTTPRHVPSVVLQVPDVPRTASGKVSEIAVRRIVHGEPAPNRTTLANPEALAHFAGRPELAVEG